MATHLLQPQGTISSAVQGCSGPLQNCCTPHSPSRCLCGIRATYNVKPKRYARPWSVLKELHGTATAGWVLCHDASDSHSSRLGSPRADSTLWWELPLQLGNALTCSALPQQQVRPVRRRYVLHLCWKLGKLGRCSCCAHWRCQHTRTLQGYADAPEQVPPAPSHAHTEGRCRARHAGR